MTTLSSTTRFVGRVIKVDVEEVVLPNGTHAELELVRHPGGAAVVALDAEERVCLLYQYRHAAGGYLWELPAGKLEKNEQPLATAQRELVEEGGVSARDWHGLGTYLSSPGVFTEVLHLFLATGIERAVAAPESNEVFEVHWVPFREACRRALDGDIRDGKTVLGLLRASHLRRTVLAPADP